MIDLLTDFAKMAEEEPDVLLANAELILGREDTVELLSKATRKDPASALKYAAQYIEFYPYVLDAAILADPAAFEKYYPSFKDDRLYDPGYLMYSFDDMVKNPDAVCYFRTLAKYSPYGLLSEHETFEKFLKLPYAAEVLKQIDVENWFILDEFYYQSILRASADINFYGAILHLLKQDDFRNYLYKHLAEFKKASPYMYEHVLWDIFYEDTQIAVRYFEENKNDKLYRKVLLEAIKNKFGIYYPHNQEAFTSMSYALSDLKDAAFYEEVIESVAPGFSIPIFLGFKSMMGVAEDPALRSILNIHRSWLPNMDTREFVNHSSWICRNLYFQNREVSESNVKDEYSRILTRKAELESLPLFSGRNIVLASHGENWGVKDAYQDRFGNYALQGRLQAQQGSGYEFKHFEPKSDTLSEIKKAKEESMNAIASTKPPLTYVFDGHGSKDSFFFSDGQLVDELTRQPVVETEKTIKVTYEEFAEILLKRRANFGDKALAKDIFIFSQCYNHNFVRKVNEILKSKGSTCPIMIGESEYDVSSLSDTESKYENYFYDDV
jgi:hypothetical protein